MPQTAISLPPRTTRHDGTPRRVGVELEFADLDAPGAASVVRGLFGGEIVVKDPHRCKVRDTVLGDFTVELDMRAAHPEEAAENGAPAKSGEAVKNGLRRLWGNIGSLVMPFEIAAPPIPFDRLGELDRLVTALREAGARGTHASPLFAFGMHLNPEVAEETADYALDHLKAFLILAAWLRGAIKVDATRRLSGFIASFPPHYAAKVVDPAYRPEMEGLVTDYLTDNPSRNRELDLFPLFAKLAPDILFARVSDPHVRARPTFHYRLPNALVGDPAWTLAEDWNRWVAVERLAADRDRLDGLGLAYRDRLRRGDLGGWAEECARDIGEA
ncbi:amidoligase family protein [Azospirillum sp. RWY-5-1]|uniref:Amidoligase family protein n=1 Tax=Azospirillum oleiclasticum TaxID=2735135 RepID=A0ABX2TI54_9PROT|nr:amidoligase family protein [Azospirillum oleiclasticum]NYZ14658.1 amidoligase family protein [Azospirillum oleiclasticum]NYZ22355.1 amidoligase family protein [Azospirillum oleiclasticum]